MRSRAFVEVLGFAVVIGDSTESSQPGFLRMSTTAFKDESPFISATWSALPLIPTASIAGLGARKIHRSSKDNLLVAEQYLYIMLHDLLFWFPQHKSELKKYLEPKVASVLDHRFLVRDVFFTAARAEMESFTSPLMEAGPDGSRWPIVLQCCLHTGILIARNEGTWRL